MWRPSFLHLVPLNIAAVINTCSCSARSTISLATGAAERMQCVGQAQPDEAVAAMVARWL